MVTYVAVILRTIKAWIRGLLHPILCIYYRRQSQYSKSGKIALCCIAKMENDYVRFFVEYYKNLHFDKIFIYDNNEPDGERFEEVIGDYVTSHYVDVIDFRGRKDCQLTVYQDCYDKHNKEYDWIAFFDCDEFLTFSVPQDIHSFLGQKKFLPFQVMHVNWKVYGDNEMLDNDGRNVIERFETPLPDETEYGFFGVKYMNNHVKSLIRGGLSKVTWKKSWHPHSFQSPYYRCCNPEGVLVDVNLPHQKISHETLYLRHYSCKTIGEYVRNKMRKGRPDRSDEEGLSFLNLDSFFRYNKKTEAKLMYANKIMMGLEEKMESYNERKN